MRSWITTAFSWRPTKRDSAECQRRTAAPSVSSLATMGSRDFFLDATHRRLTAIGIAVTSGALLAARVNADDKPLLHEWREIGKNHWQILTPPGETPEETDAAEG